ncbi:YrdC/Sua5 family protein, required for threonylcarbamoyladenosine (t(6)A) formation in tRNA [Rubellimicrobium mesophilum DSM 19309]|uniref:Threonylcarbamoyl-AMP synthase n=1 Tax=Rubellimicrobium mesophilum DSM 19309 TaxID=442562 RepID=A0A017HR83_9RHOB|nr:L-threonylcarbamoyladenylate synthase [Rubellimicrobium mesophilum]EYD76886.1 YrdC/Sua5 family protein, required for threonylcarbamoyladenosine (t(6)A) formation in tRNA [Rubellimicrobium mesophilum DSM 19309]
MTDSETRRLGPDAKGVAEAAAILRGGGLVAFPTETVYGLGADAGNGRAVAGIYAAKGRPSFNPLIVHVEGAEAAGWLAEVTDKAADLMAAFWPGPLTLVLTAREGTGLSPLVQAGLPTVALRAPAHPLARELLREAGRPLAAPSANPSGRVSPTTADHVLAGLAGRIDAVLDGGACPVGVESTILALDGPPRLLRAGGLPVEALEAALGERIGVDTSPERVAAPGQMASHYAPRGSMRLNVREPEPGEVMLGFGDVPGQLTLSATGDLQEAAANLFGCLHALDAMGAERIAVAPVPDRGLGRAINDRLRRAAAPRG